MNGDNFERDAAKVASILIGTILLAWVVSESAIMLQRATLRVTCERIYPAEYCRAK